MKTSPPATHRQPARSPQAQSSIGVTLPALSSTWPRDSALSAAAGVASFGAAPLAGHPGWAIPGLIAGIGAAGCCAARGRRAMSRTELADSVIVALAPLLGLGRPSRAAVRVSSWTHGWPGVPRRIDLTYGPGLADDDPAWRDEIGAVVNRRLLTAEEQTRAVYRIVFQRSKKRQIRLRLTPRQFDTAPQKPAVQVRAERGVSELLGPTARVSGVEWDGDQLAAISAAHEAGTKLAAAGYRHRIERVLSTMLPGRWRAVWDLENDTVRFEVRPSFPSSIWLPVRDIDEGADILASYDHVWIPYGVDEDGNEMVWRPAHDPNVMVVGAPGSGKTVADHTILVEASRYGWPIWVVDGKSIEFLGFQPWPNVQIVATRIEEQIAVIHRAYEVMEHRYSLITSGGACEADFEPLILFVDEFADFRASLAAWYTEVKVKGDPTKPVVLSRLQSIARKGRTSRVHLVFSTQRPDAEYFGGDMRDNFRMRISMGRLSPQGSMMMWESPAVGTSIPRGCRGRATTINDHNRPVEIQTYRTPDPRKTAPGSDEADLLARLRPKAARHERLLIVPPEPVTDLDSSQPPPATYTDYACAQWVRAAARPDLDPVARRAEPAVSGRELSSPLAVFGLTNPSGQRPSGTFSRPPRPVVMPDVVEDGIEDYFGFGPVTSSTPSRLTVGDLLLVDEDTDQWAIVDSEPDEDLSDTDCVMVTWRGDGDEEGAISLPADELVTVRRPLASESAE